MKLLNIQNPFCAPIYHFDTVSSTMDVSKELAQKEALHGTVITADYQNSGRGRIKNRSWDMDTQKGLSFTILLCFNNIETIPKALTLRIGLAVSYAIEDFEVCLKDRVFIKWPNDIIIDDKKAVGILCEADGGKVHVGIGINVAQDKFEHPLCEKATSIALAANRSVELTERFLLLEKVLENIYKELKKPNEQNWKLRLEKRLYKIGKQVSFIEGAADSKKTIQGILTGINDNGELLIMPNGETLSQAFFTGELRFC